MGEKGAKLTREAGEVCRKLVETLAPLGEVRDKKMFGGYGIFESGMMFALINSRGEVYFKADDSNRSRYEKIAALQHARMPYFQVPENILSDPEELRVWAQESLAVARQRKKK